MDEGGGCRVPVRKGLYGMTVVSLGEEGLGSRSTHAKLRDKASLRSGKCSDQYMKNFYCLACDHACLSQSEHDQPLDG